MKPTLPQDFVPVSRQTCKLLNDCVKECLVDASCFCNWIDGTEYEIRNYISDKAYVSFNGFARSLIYHLNLIENICKSLDLSLSL